MNDDVSTLRRSSLLSDPRELARVLGLEKGLQRQGRGVIVRCPAHDDKNASCSIHVGSDGTVACRCHACGWSADALGLVAKVNGLDTDRDFPRVKELAAQLAGVTLEPRQAPAQERRLVAEYDYTDAAGALLYQVLRFEPKTFRQRKPDGSGGWEWKLNGVARVLYHLPELLAADPDAKVYIAEGEKDVDAMRSLGLLATTNAQGAGKWSTVADLARGVLRDRDVVVIADKDEPGRKHAREVFASLVGVARDVRLVEVPDGKDAAEWIARGAQPQAFLALEHHADLLEERPAEPAEPELVDPEAPAKPAETKWAWIEADELFKPKTPPAWTVKDLGFAPGRPNLLSGPSSGAKTMLAQSLLLSLAARRHLWSCWEPLDRPLVCAHLDVDLGQDDLEFRYRRLLAGWPGAPITADDLRARLKFISFPNPRIDLMSEGARDMLKRQLEGVDLCFGDALRGLADGDENSSEYRRALDTAAAISNDTKVVFLFAHHTGNPMTDARGKAVEDDKHGRGSSAIKDGAGTILRIGGSKLRGRKVWMHKPPGRTGVEWTDKYKMDITAPPSDDPSLEGSGLRVTLSKLSAEAESDAEAMSPDEAAKVTLATEHDRRQTMLAMLRAAGTGGFGGGVEVLARQCADSLKSRGKGGWTTAAARAVFRELETEGEAVSVGATNKRRLYLRSLAPQPTLAEVAEANRQEDK